MRALLLFISTCGVSNKEKVDIIMEEVHKDPELLDMALILFRALGIVDISSFMAQNSAKTPFAKAMIKAWPQGVQE